MKSIPALFKQILPSDDRWFSSDTPVSSTNKTDRHNITEILLKVALKQRNPSDDFC
jgi:hypothetical protein